MWTFSVRTNRPIREAARDILRKVQVADELGMLTTRQHRQALSNYGFVAAPPGVGWDTHRVWEALYLGCVPIVLDSFFARDLVDRGLPVWIVESYSVLEGISSEHLEQKYVSLASGFDSPHLFFPSWEADIFAVSKSLGRRV